MKGQPEPDVYQDKLFSPPQYVYNKKCSVIAQISISDDGCLWFREASPKHNEWGGWIKKHNFICKI